MKIADIKVGMHVVPVSSTHPRGKPIESLYGKSSWPHHMHKGYLIVCEICMGREPYEYSVGDTEPITVYCHEDGRKKAWGNGNQWSWLSFIPEDLEPFTQNDKWFHSLKGG